MGSTRALGRSALDRRIGLAFVSLVSLLLAARVWSQAWVCEDAFITFRYVANLLDGRGAVFNAGEHVQGYTHPLWLIVLALASLLYRDPVIVSAVLSLLFTVAMVVVVGRKLLLEAEDRLWAIGLLTLFCFVHATSRTWVSFQTAGLENSLSNLLLALLAIQLWWSRAIKPAVLGLTLGSLVLSRPDLLLISAPIGCAYVAGHRRLADRIRFAAGLGPVLLWAVFAWSYYGTVVANTAHAKIGIWSSWRHGVSQGLTYVGDFAAHEPMFAAVAAGLFIVACRCSRESVQRWFLVGVVLYASYVVWIGGGFMRGRMLLPVLFASSLSGILVAGRLARPGRSALAGGIATLAVLLAFQAWLSASLSAEISDAGIVDEQAYYPGYRLSFYLDRGHVTNPYRDLDFARELQSFVTKCGPVSIHARNPGTIGYLAGPEVSVIDTLGLTDAFIARLPRANLVMKKPRPGHPDKIIPLSYLASKKDISIISGWESAVANLDCSVTERACALARSTAYWKPFR